MAIITHEKLLAMQAARRHVYRKKEKVTRNYADMLEVRTMEEILKADVAAELEEKKHQQAAARKEINRQRAIARQKPKVFLPDLMAEMLTDAPKTEPVAAPVDRQEPEIELPKEVVAPEKRAYFAPKPKKEILKWERPIQRVPGIPDQPPKPFERPPARYSNIASPYGIWTEMAQEQLKKSG